MMHNHIRLVLKIQFRDVAFYKQNINLHFNRDIGLRKH